jgi:hypothetical protein
VRALPLIPMVVLVGLPVITLPLLGIAVPAGAAALAIGAGAFGGVGPLVAAGAALALIDYGLALWLTAAPADPLGAALFGVALVLVLETADFHRRFRGAIVSAAALRGQAFRWAVGAVLGLVAATALAALALVGLRLPPGMAPLLAAAGAIGVIAGVAGALSRLTSPPVGEDNPNP